MVSSKKSNTIAAVGTVIFMLMVFLILWFIYIDRFQQPEDEGIEVAFGVDEDGGGFQPEQTTGGLEEAAAPPAPQEPSNNDLIAQEDEESVEVQRQREEAEQARQQAERERLERERQLAEQRAKEQAAIAKANQLGALFGNNNAGAAGSGDTQGDSQRGNSEVGKGSSGGNNWSLAGRKCKALPKPSNDFKQEGKVVVAIIVDGNGKVVSAKATEGTTISNDATIQLALKAAYKAEFSFTDRPDKQFGTITYIFKFN